MRTDPGCARSAALLRDTLRARACHRGLSASPRPAALARPSPAGWAAPRAPSPFTGERSVPLPPDAPLEAVRAAWETERRAVWELKSQVSALEAVKEANEKDIRSLLADLAAAGRDPKTATPGSAAANAAAAAAVEEAKTAQARADAAAAAEAGKKGNGEFDLNTASGRAAAAAQQLLKAGARTAEVEHLKAELAASRAMARLLCPFRCCAPRLPLAPPRALALRRSLTLPGPRGARAQVVSLREQLDKAYEAAMMGGDDLTNLRQEELKQMEQEVSILNEAVDSLQVAVEAERSRCQELQQQLAKKTRELIRVQGELDRLRGVPRDGHLAGGSQYSGAGGEASRPGSVYGGASVGGSSQASARPPPTEEQLASARRILEAGRAAAERSAGARAAAGAGGGFAGASAGAPSPRHGGQQGRMPVLPVVQPRTAAAFANYGNGFQPRVGDGPIEYDGEMDPGVPI